MKKLVMLLGTMLLAVGSAAHAAPTQFCIDFVNFCDGDCGGAVIGMAVVGSAFYIGAGAGMGALIDAARVKRTTLYFKSSSQAPVSFAPILAPHAAGVRVSLQWPRRRK